MTSLFELNDTDWLEAARFHFPCPIQYGPGVSLELPSFLKEQNLTRALVVSDGGFAKTACFQECLRGWQGQNSGVHFTPFHEISKNPTDLNVKAGVDLFLKEKCDVVVGFGGGASIDVARAIALWSHHQHLDLLIFDDAKGGDRFVSNKVPPLVALPTTSGTGSEVGRSAVIASHQTGQKFILFSPHLVASKVYLDPKLTVGVPAPVTAACGVDALTHLVEGVLAKGVHPMAEGIALRGIQLVFESLKTCVEEPDNLVARGKMQVASMMGAVAFQKGLGIIHAAVHPLSSVYDLHHGLGCALMLPFGLEYNLKARGKLYSHILKVLGEDNTAPEAFIELCKKLNAELGLPTHITECVGPLKDVDLDQLTTLALADPSHSTNPITVSAEDFRSFYQRAFAC